MYVIKYSYFHLSLNWKEAMCFGYVKRILRKKLLHKKMMVPKFQNEFLQKERKIAPFLSGDIRASKQTNAIFKICPGNIVLMTISLSKTSKLMYWIHVLHDLEPKLHVSRKTQGSDPEDKHWESRSIGITISAGASLSRPSFWILSNWYHRSDVIDSLESREFNISYPIVLCSQVPQNSPASFRHGSFSPRSSLENRAQDKTR